MASFNLSESIFSVGPKDTQATVDVYNAGSSNIVINNVNSITTKTDDSVIVPIQGNTDKQKNTSTFDLSSAANAAISVLGTTKGQSNTQVLNRVANTSESSKFFSGISQSAGSLIASTSNQFGLPNSIGVSIGNTISKISVSNLANAANLTGVIRNITGINGSAKITDPRTTGIILGSIINAATGMGVKGTAGVVITGNTNKDTLQSVAKTIVGYSLKKNNTKDLKDIAINTTPGTIKSSCPKAISDYGNASSNTTTKQSTPELITTYNDCIDLFNTIDPTWNSKTKGTRSCTDISSIITRKGDFTGLNNTIRAGAVDSNDNKTTDYLAASTFDKTEIGMDISNRYPSIVNSKPPITTGEFIEI